MNDLRPRCDDAAMTKRSILKYANQDDIARQWFFYPRRVLLYDLQISLFGSVEMPISGKMRNFSRDWYARCTINRDQ